MATADFMVEGRSFAGFPLLLNSDGWPLKPAQSFLWNSLVTNGSIESKLTWEAMVAGYTTTLPSWLQMG